MNRENDLISIMAGRYQIERGTTEPVEQWQMREIYSVLGQMAYASLWDKTEDDQPISVVHFKSRMKDLLESYCGIFNGLRKLFGYNYENLLEEIYNVQLEGGKIYHSAYRLAPASYSASAVDDVLFARGMAPDEQQFVSGQGTYLLSSDFQESIPLLEMFQLPDQTLTETWRYLVKTAKWNQFCPNDTTEFLRTDPPFKYGYWQREKPVAQEVTLIRMGMNGNRFYYLYQEKGGQAFVSQLPVWMTEDHFYRRVSNALLSAKQSLPAATYHEDGAIVMLRLQYLPAVEELNLIKLYSWPTSCIELPHDFNRIFAKDVFYAIKKTLEAIGYQFVKE